MSDKFATLSISAVVPRPSDGVGLVAEGSAIPKMRGRAVASDETLALQLQDALEALAGALCSFWACNGPTRPAPMTTCSKCYAMRRIASVQASLRRRGGDPARPQIGASQQKETTA